MDVSLLVTFYSSKEQKKHVPRAATQGVFGLALYLAYVGGGGLAAPFKALTCRNENWERWNKGRYIFSTGKSPASVDSQLTRTINSWSRQFQRNNFQSCCCTTNYWEIIIGKCTDSRVWFLGRISQTPPQIIMWHISPILLALHSHTFHMLDYKEFKAQIKVGSYLKCVFQSVLKRFINTFLYCIRH